VISGGSPTLVGQRSGSARKPERQRHRNGLPCCQDGEGSTADENPESSVNNLARTEMPQLSAAHARMCSDGKVMDTVPCCDSKRTCRWRHPPPRLINSRRISSPTGLTRTTTEGKKSEKEESASENWPVGGYRASAGRGCGWRERSFEHDAGGP